MITATHQAQLLDRVENLFLRFGIKSITMDDVASELGISKKTLYQWFESKDHLVIKVLEHHISREKSNYLGSTAKTRNAIDEILVLLECNTQELSQMKSNVINDLQKYHHDAWEMIRKYQYDFMYKMIRKNLIRGREEGLYREDFDLDVIARLHLAAAFTLFDSELFPESAGSKATLFKEYMMLYLHGIISARGLTYLKKNIN